MQKGKLEWIDDMYTSSDCYGSDCYYKEKRNKWCIHEGKKYVFLDYAMGKISSCKFAHGYPELSSYYAYFFKCQPVQAEYTEDGSIQVKQALFPAKFEEQDKYANFKLEITQELDTDQFNIGQRLNEFKRELELSVGIVGENIKAKMLSKKNLKKLINI